jgi:RNA polymerase sigma-70 factor (ECF subfamily)
MKHSSFHTTHWSVVLAAKGDNTKAGAALSELCKSYRQPILRYIGRTLRADASLHYGGRNAEDLTHDFLVRLLEGKLFERVHPTEGRFRTYLLGAVRYFLSSVRNQESAEKRGGGVMHLPVQDDIPQTDDAAVFDCDWARTTINQATALLGEAEETQMLVPWLTREMTTEDRERLAGELGKTEAAVKVALHRLRKKFRQHVREQIAHTVESEKEIDAELGYLIRALTRF